MLTVSDWLKTTKVNLVRIQSFTSWRIIIDQSTHLAVHVVRSAKFELEVVWDVSKPHQKRSPRRTYGLPSEIQFRLKIHLIDSENWKLLERILELGWVKSDYIPVENWMKVIGAMDDYTLIKNNLAAIARALRDLEEDFLRSDKKMSEEPE